MSEVEQTIESEEQADALLAEIESSNEESHVDQSAKPDPQQQQAMEEYSLTVGGKEIKAKRDQLLKWAQQGYDAPNRIGDLNKQLESWKQKEAQFKELESKYGTVDQYVRDNPQWWQYVQDQYGKLQEQNNNPLMTEVSTLKQQVSDLLNYKNQIVMSQEDKAYQEEFTQLQKQYPKVDFQTPDESGKSLEYKVLEYAQANGIKKFQTAFRDFYHDEILRIKEEEAKEKVINDKRSASKLGILGISSTPTTKRSNDSVKGKSYNDLEKEILEELGLR